MILQTKKGFKVILTIFLLFFSIMHLNENPDTSSHSEHTKNFKAILTYSHLNPKIKIHWSIKNSMNASKQNY